MSDTPKMRGGITVAGLVTGSYLIADIKVSVPHQVAVYIPAEQAYRSKDLWRGIGQQRLFQLTGGSGLAFEPSTSAPVFEVNDKLAEAPSDNKKMHQDLENTRQQNAELQAAVQSMQGQLGAILKVLGKFESGEIPLAAVPQVVNNIQAAVGSNHAVGGEVPFFLPDDTTSEGKANFVLEAEVVEGSSVMNAAKLLRKARRSQG